MIGRRIVVFGASGPTGRHILGQARTAGHEVVAVTRRPDSIPPQDHVQVVGADVVEQVAVERAVAGADAVLSCIGVPYSRNPIDLYSTGTTNILTAMDRHAVRRLVVVSSAPLDPDYRASDAWLFTRVMEPLFMRRPGRTTYEDMARMESLVISSDVDWTIVRSSWLFEAEPVTDYRLTTGTPRGMYTARPDLAAAMLAQLTESRHLRRIIAVNTSVATPRLAAQIWHEKVKGPARDRP